MQKHPLKCALGNSAGVCDGVRTICELALHAGVAVTALNVSGVGALSVLVVRFATVNIRSQTSTMGAAQRPAP